MAKETKGKGFTGRTAAWIGLAGAAVVGLYFWAQKGKGEKLNAHYSFDHVGHPEDFKVYMRIGSLVTRVPYIFNTRDPIPVVNKLEADIPASVEGDLQVQIPTGLGPEGPYDIEFSIRNIAGDFYNPEFGKTLDLQENKIELLGTGKFNLL